MMSDIEIVQGAVIQRHDTDERTRWEIRHYCGGLQRRITVVDNGLACLDCGENIHVFDSPDVDSGHVAVISDMGISARDES